MQRFYGIDLGDALFGEPPMRVSRLWELVRNMPAESALVLRSIAERGPVAVPSSAPPPEERVVTSLRGVNLRQMMDVGAN
jgi:hypothetical protein